MKLAKTSRILGLAAFTVITIPFAQANDSGWYIGANLGHSQANIDEDALNNELLGGGFTTTSLKEDDTDIGYRLFGGYQFNRYIALEGAYVDLGEFGYKASTLPLGSVNGSIELTGLNIDLVGILPITEHFSALGRIGASHIKASDEFSGTGFVVVSDASPSGSDTSYKFGLGLQYAFTRSFDVRGEVERYRVDDAIGNKGDVDLLSIGMLYRFGQNNTAAASANANVTPVPVVVAGKDVTPPYATLAVPYKDTIDVSLQRHVRIAFSEEIDPDSINTETVMLYQGEIPFLGKVEMPTSTTASFVPAGPLTPDTVYTGKLTTGIKDLAGNAMKKDHEWSFRTAAVTDPSMQTEIIILDQLVMLEDTHFTFDQATLTAEGENMLKLNIRIMKNNPNLKVRIAGYTSAAGTKQYNQDLSERRAGTVMAYLIEEGNIAPERLGVIGYGETRPAQYEELPSDISSKAAKANMRVLFEVIVK